MGLWMVKTIFHNRILASQEDADAVAQVALSGAWACGQQTALFEEELTTQTGKKYATCVSSGSDALRLCLLKAGVGAHDKVIIPAYSCVSLANAVLSLGALPVVADILPDSWNLDPQSVQEHIDNKTKAIIAVHMFGQPLDTQELNLTGISLIEDCSHGFGCEFSMPSPHCSFALASLYATKFLGAGEGGVIWSDDKSADEWFKDYRDYADKAPGQNRGNYKMTDLEAALGRSRLKRLKDIRDWRKKLAMQYREALQLAKLDSLLALPPLTERIWYRYPVFPKEHSADYLIEKLAERSIIAAKPVEPWRKLSPSLFPVSVDAYNNIVSLPFHEGLAREDITYIVQNIAQILEE